MEIALIHHPALIENDNAVCHTGNRVQIVRDKHHRDLVLALDAQQFIQDFKLGDCVNRSGRLVGDQQLGRYSRRNADHNALQHTAGKLVRVLFKHLLRVADAHHVQHVQRAAADLRCIPRIMRGKGLRDLRADPVQRVKAGHGILQDNAYLAASQAAQLLRTPAQQIFALKTGAAGYTEVFVQQPHGCLHGHGFAAARLAQNAETLACCYR